ncbi:hypothetical protein M9458_051434, partial [Cirrhinus mrigala]
MLKNDFSQSENVSGYDCNPGSPKGTRRCVYKRFGERLQREHALNHICNQSNREERRHRNSSCFYKRFGERYAHAPIVPSRCLVCARTKDRRARSDSQ